MTTGNLGTPALNGKRKRSFGQHGHHVGGEGDNMIQSARLGGGRGEQERTQPDDMLNQTDQQKKTNSMQDVLDRIVLGGGSGTSRPTTSNSSTNDGSNTAPRIATVLSTRTTSSLTASHFIPSAKWQGSKPGYYFRLSELGLGYYRDTSYSEPPSVAALPSGRAAASGLLLQPPQQPVAKKQRHSGGVQIDEERNETFVFEKMEPETSNATTTAGTASSGVSIDMMLLAQAEEEASLRQTRVMDLTGKGVRIAATNLIKSVQRNEMERIEYPNEPNQYMESEVMLFENLVALKAIAVDPMHLYPIVLNETQLIPTLIQLLLHDNTDVIVSVISVLLEFLDSTLLVQDDEDESEEGGGGRIVEPVVALASTILRDGVEYIVGILARLEPTSKSDTPSDEMNDEVGKGSEDVLSLLENLMEMDTIIQTRNVNGNNSSLQLVPDGLSVAARLCQRTSLVSWLFQQIVDNGPYQSRSLELLAVLSPREDVYTILPDWSKLPIFQSSVVPDDDNDRKPCATNAALHDTNNGIHSIDGIEILLQTVATFRKSQPTDDQQLEMLENACIVMASLLTFSPINIPAFLDAQGIELVVRCLKERVHAGGVTLKWLDFAGLDPTWTKTAYERLIKADAMKYLFPLFMGRNMPQMASGLTTTISKKDKKQWHSIVETTTIRILYGLVCHVQDDSPDDAKERLLAKFLPDEKCSRLCALFQSYDNKSRLAEYQFFRSDTEEKLPNEESIQLAALNAKLAAGGDIVQRLAAIIAFCCLGSKRCHENIIVQLHQRQLGIGLVREVLIDFISVLGEGEQRKRLQYYVDNI